MLTNFLRKNVNESIMLTTRFFHFFEFRLPIHFAKMDIYKCPNRVFKSQTQNFKIL
jgi:hypothetical protein